MEMHMELEKVSITFEINGTKKKLIYEVNNDKI